MGLFVTVMLCIVHGTQMARMGKLRMFRGEIVPLSSFASIQNNEGDLLAQESHIGAKVKDSLIYHRMFDLERISNLFRHIPSYCKEGCGDVRNVWKLQ